LIGLQNGMDAASIVARYLQDVDGGSYATFSDFMSPEDVRQKILEHHLKLVEQSVAKLLQ